MIVDNRPGAAGGSAWKPRSNRRLTAIRWWQSATRRSLCRSLCKAPYDLARDITPITTVATITNTLIVNPSLPANSVQELVAYSKSKPNAVRFGSGGTGRDHASDGKFFRACRAPTSPHVPSSGFLSVNATLGGEIEMIFLNAFQAAPLIQSGKFRGLAVTSLQRSRFLPALPTLDESGLERLRGSGVSQHCRAARLAGRRSQAAALRNRAGGVFPRRDRETDAAGGRGPRCDPPSNCGSSSRPSTTNTSRSSKRSVSNPSEETSAMIVRSSCPRTICGSAWRTASCWSSGGHGSRR